MNARLLDSMSSILGLARAACLVAAIFDAIGVVWFIGSQSVWFRILIWPAPFIALIYVALAPKRWFANVLGIGIAAALYLLAAGELLRRLGIYWTMAEEGSAFSFVVDLIEIGLLTLVFLGRVIQHRFERTDSSSQKSR